MSLYDPIHEHVVLPWLDRRRPRRVLPRIADWTRVLALPRASLATEQRRRLSAIVQHAAATNTLWRQRFSAAGIDPRAVGRIEDLSALPLLGREEVRARGRELLSDAVAETSRIETQTGGSTSLPLPFWRDVDCQAEREALAWAFYGWYGRRPQDRYALVWGAPSDLPRVRAWRARLRTRFLERFVVLPAQSMSDREIDAFFDRMRGFAPRFMHGYAQSIFLLARRAEERGLRFPSLRGVSVTAEPIETGQQTYIEKIFGCPVQNVYGCREFGMMAAQRPGGSGLYLNSLSTVVETLRADGTPAAPGETGEIVVTDLINRAMPLLRYRLEDLGAFRPTDPGDACELPVLDVTAGRASDFFILPDGRFISCLVAIDLAYARELQKVQLVQQTAGLVDVRYVPKSDLRLAVLETIGTKLRQVLGPQVEIRFIQVDDIPLTPSGKTVLAVSELYRSRTGVRVTVDPSDR